MEPFVSAQTPQISYLARGEVDAINAAFSLDDLWESSMATGEAANEARASASGLPSTLVPHSVTVQSSFFHVYFTTASCVAATANTYLPDFAVELGGQR